MPTGETIVDAPYLTSDTGFVNVYLTGVYPDAATHIYPTIQDFRGKKVGLKISDLNPNIRKSGRGLVWLWGNEDNTFSGDVYVMDDNILALSKAGGHTEVRGNIFTQNGGAICIDKSNQIANHSTITMDGIRRSSEFYFNGDGSNLEEAFHKLIVKGDVHLRFYHSLPRLGTMRVLYLDDLIIESGGALRIFHWTEKTARLLVRKTSAHLYDSLNRIRFEGYDPNAVHLEGYNRDYWSISGTPEPSTYGAIFTSGVLGLGLWQRRRKAHKNRSGTLDAVLR